MSTNLPAGILTALARTINPQSIRAEDLKGLSSTKLGALKTRGFEITVSTSAHLCAALASRHHVASPA